MKEMMKSLFVMSLALIILVSLLPCKLLAQPGLMQRVEALEFEVDTLQAQNVSQQSQIDNLVNQIAAERIRVDALEAVVAELEDTVATLPKIVAKGIVDIDGTVFESLGVESVAWNPSVQAWDVTLSEIAYNVFDFVTLITSPGDSTDRHFTAWYSSPNDVLRVYLWKDGAKIRERFSFVIIK